MTLPPLKLSASDRRFLAVELDIAAEGYEDCIHFAFGQIDPDAKRTAKKLRALAVRMRGGSLPPEIEGEAVRLEDLPVTLGERHPPRPEPAIEDDPRYMLVDGRYVRFDK